MSLEALMQRFEKFALETPERERIMFEPEADLSRLRYNDYLRYMVNYVEANTLVRTIAEAFFISNVRDVDAEFELESLNAEVAKERFIQEFYDKWFPRLASLKPGERERGKRISRISFLAEEYLPTFKKWFEALFKGESSNAVNEARGFVAETINLMRVADNLRANYMARLKGESDRIFDAVTGAFTRDYFMQRLEEHMSTAKNGGSISSRATESAGIREKAEPYRFSMVYIDLNDLKAINDDFGGEKYRGHASGNIYLRSFCDALKSELRKFDLVGRLGGDEIGIILPNADANQAAAIIERVAPRVIERVSEILRKELGYEQKISFGAGIECSDNASDAKELEERADSAQAVSKAITKIEKYPDHPASLAARKAIERHGIDFGSVAHVYNPSLRELYLESEKWKWPR